MKHEIIKTDNYLLVVDESEIKGWYYDAYINKVKHSGGAEYGESIITRNIIAHLPLNGSPILEGVDLLPPLEDDVDVEKMAFGQYGNGEDNRTMNAFIDGYTQALEDNKDKKYTEEDLRKAMKYASEITNNKMKYMEDYIQSLSQPKIPIGFQCEMEDKIALDGHTIIGTEPITEDMIPMILEYNRNDVLSTKAFYELCILQPPHPKDIHNG